MRRRQYLLLVILTAISGVIGGVVSGWLFIALPVYAQGEEQNEKVIKAEEIQFVDKKGVNLVSVFPVGSGTLMIKKGKSAFRVSVTDDPDGVTGLWFEEFRREENYIVSIGRIALTLTDGRPSIHLHDGDGDNRVEVSLSRMGNPAIRLRDENREVIFSAP